MSSFNIDKPKSLQLIEIRSPSAIPNILGFETLEKYPCWVMSRHFSNPSCRSHLCSQVASSVTLRDLNGQKKTLTKTQGSRDWLGTTRSKKGIVSICLNYFWHSDSLRKLVLILDGSSSLLRPFWTFAAAKSQKAGHLGVLQVQGIGWVACRCDKLMTCSKWLQYNHPQNGVRICSTTQAKPACGPRVDSIFERSLMECHEAGPAASKLGEGQISTGCPLLPFLDIMNLACEDINEDLSLHS